MLNAESLLVIKIQYILSTDSDSFFFVSPCRMPDNIEVVVVPQKYLDCPKPTWQMMSAKALELLGGWATYGEISRKIQVG